MADVCVPQFGGWRQRMVDMGDGTYAPQVIIAGYGEGVSGQDGGTPVFGTSIQQRSEKAMADGRTFQWSWTFPMVGESVKILFVTMCPVVLYQPSFHVSGDDRAALYFGDGLSGRGEGWERSAPVCANLASGGVARTLVSINGEINAASRTLLTEYSGEQVKWPVDVFELPVGEYLFEVRAHDGAHVSLQFRWEEIYA